MNRIFRPFAILVHFDDDRDRRAAAVATNDPVIPYKRRSRCQAEPKPCDPVRAAQVDKAAAYYHYTLAHMYEEMVTAYGRSDLAAKATEEYRLAIDADPSSEFLTSALAELYVKTGRIADAVKEAQDIIKRDPKNLEAHKLLGRIYLRSLGDMPGGSGSDNILKLAIDQYEQIVKLDPDSVDDHLLLGRLYRLNNDLQKAEGELKTAIKLDPSSEEAVTTLAMLYTDEGDTAHALQGAERHPDSARSAKLYAALGAAYEQRKDYKSAIDAFRRAVVLDRDNLDAIRGLAENLLNDGQLDAALEQYKVIADSNPEDAQTYVRMAEIYRRQAQYDLALENLKRADTMVPDTMDVPYSMAAVYQAQGRYDDAIKLLQDLLKRTEKSETRIQPGRPQQPRHLHRAPRHGLSRAGKLHRRRRYLPQDADLGDENARSGYQEIIDTYREAKQWPQATAAAKEAVQKLPDDRDLRMVLDAQLADTGTSTNPSPTSAPCSRAAPTIATSIHPSRHHLHPRQALERRRGRSRPKPSSFPPSPTTKPTFTSCAATSTSARKCSTRPKPSSESPGVDLAHDPQSRRHLELSRLHECRSRCEARRISQLHQAGSEPRSQQRRLSRLPRLGVLQARQIRSGGRKSDQGRSSHGLRPDGAGASRRSLPENRTPETGRRPLGAFRPGMEQDRSRRAGHRSLRQSPAKTRRRQSKAGQRRIHESPSKT
jgi:tetratricopeptide (TPR) repeat protein